jgi:membrane-bound ClpP family serine protease
MLTLAHLIHSTFPASWFAGLALLAVAIVVLHLELRAPRP